MSKVQRSFRYRLDPTASQRKHLERLANARRFVWNWALETRIAHYRSTGKNIPRADLGRALTQLKRDPRTTWLNEADSQSLQQALDDLGFAFRAFFERRAKFPRFKSSKRDPNRFRIPQRCRIADNCVRVPKVGLIRVRVSRPIDGETGAATFKEDSNGNWFVTFVVHEPEPEPPAGSGGSVGIDLGIRRFATFSNGEQIANPRFLERDRRRLTREHRRLSKKRPGSRRQTRQRRRLAKTYRNVANRRRDFLHKLTTETVRSYSSVSIEDLNVSGLARAKLSRCIHDVAFREFRRQLTYKASEAACELRLLDRFFPSSKTCSACGHYEKNFSTASKVWRCGCGLVIDRDLNAARNIEKQTRMAAGGADMHNARGATVRPTTEGGTRRSANPTAGTARVRCSAPYRSEHRPETETDYSSSPSSRR